MIADNTDTDITAEAQNQCHDHPKADNDINDEPSVNCLAMGHAKTMLDDHTQSRWDNNDSALE